MGKNLLRLIVMLMMISGPVFAQTITGKVTTSGDGQALPGVSILVKGSTNGTTTGIDGQFSINASSQSTLIVSFIGYKTKEVLVGNKTVVEVALEEDAAQLNEVVVTALGIKREQKALGYAASTISSKDITASGNTNFGSALYGKAPGVKITTAPGGATSAVNIQVRGINSLTGNTQPLYVVDGIVIRNISETGSSGLNNGGYWGDQKIRGNGILDVNPADIETLTVLKGAGATALYGSEASNGVIVITTKSGSKGGKGLGVELNYTYNTEKVAFTPKYQNTYGPGYDRITNLSAGADEDGWFHDGVTSAPLRPYFRAYGQFGPKMEGQQVTWWDGSVKDYSARPNNYKDLYRTGSNSTINAAISSHTDKASIRFSYTRTDYSAIQRESDMKKNTFNLNSNIKLGKKLSTDVVVNYVNTNIHNRPELISRITANYGGFFSRTDDMNTYLNMYQTNSGYKYLLYNDNKYLVDESRAKYNIRASDLMEYMWRNYKNTNDEIQNRLISSATLTYNVFKNFTLRGRVGNDFTSTGTETKNYTEYPTAFNNGTNSTGGYTLASGRYSIFYGDVLATYAGNISKDLDFSVSGGYQARQEEYYNYSVGTRNGLVQENWFSLNNSVGLAEATASRSKLQKYAFLGMANLGYKNFLFLEATARKEYSSTLPPNNNSYVYTSVNSGFVFSEAFQLPAFLTYGKVRASYGIVGNSPQIYLANTTYNQKSLQTSSGSVPILQANTNYGNKNIKPENKYETELGLETKWFHNKIGLDLTYYTSRIVDQILQTDVPSSTGASTFLANVGELRSKGFEAGIYATPVATENFKWNTRLNFSVNKTMVHKLAQGINQLVAYNADGGALKIVSDVGDALGNIYVHPRLQDSNGNYVISDDGLYVMSNEYKKVGNVMPKGLGGWINNFSYKGFALDAVIDYRFGGKLVSNPLLYQTGAGMFESTMEYRDKENGGLSYYLDGEKKVLLTGNATTAPNGGRVYHDGVLLDGVTTTGEKNTTIVDAANFYMSTYGWSTGWYEKGAVYKNDYAKLRELVLSYNLPKSIAEKMHLQNIRVSLIGRNLFYIYRTLKNLDPEAPVGTSWKNQGVDEGSSAATRSYGVSLHVSF